MLVVERIYADLVRDNCNDVELIELLKNLIRKGRLKSEEEIKI